MTGFLVRPAITPGAVTLFEAKSHCRVGDDENDENDFFQRAIEAATEMAEQKTGRPLIRREFSYLLTEFEDRMVIPVADVFSVDVVKYVGPSGAYVVLPIADYRVSNSPVKSFVGLREGRSWPADIDRFYGLGAVCIDLTAGLAYKPEGIPSGVRSWILLQVGMLYENRESVVLDRALSVSEVPGVDRLLDRYRVNHYF